MHTQDIIRVYGCGRAEFQYLILMQIGDHSHRARAALLQTDQRNQGTTAGDTPQINKMHAITCFQNVRFPRFEERTAQWTTRNHAQALVVGKWYHGLNFEIYLNKLNVCSVQILAR